MQPMRRASHGILAYLAQSVHGERRTAASGYAKTRAAGNEKVSLNFKNLWCPCTYLLKVHTGKKGTPPLSEGVPYETTLIRLSQVSLDRRRREKVIWEMITEHSCNPFADLEC